VPKNWKYIKKLLEKEFLCEKLRGHITYDLTDYRPAPWYQQHFIMKYDDEVLLDVSQPERQWDKRYTRTEMNWGKSNAIAAKAYKKHHLEEYGVPLSVVERITGEVITQADKYVSHYHGIFGVHDIIDAIGVYLHSDIDTCLAWEQEEFVKALAVLDRRCGKRRLEKYAGFDHTGYPEWLRRIFQLRFDAEGIRYNNQYMIRKNN
jgi:hypothetical protein